MFRRNIILRSCVDIRAELNMLGTEIRNSDLQPQTKKLLHEQVETTLLQFEQQITSGPVQKVFANRVFEGDGFQVTVRVRYGADRR